jgi:hypothetical protein
MNDSNSHQIGIAGIDPDTCFICGVGKTSKLCDGRLESGESCDRPLCDNCTFTAGPAFFCSRQKGRSRLDTVDFCPDCRRQRDKSLGVNK